MTIPEHFRLQADPLADEGAIVRFPQARFTVLTPRLIRMEYSPNDQFEDRPSQVFWFRRQPLPKFQVSERAGKVVIETEQLRLIYQTGQPFKPETLSIQLVESGTVWHFQDENRQNLKGTGRTLDQANGAIPLENGLISRSGWALVDDTLSLVFNEQGWLEPRNAAAGYQDLYFFGYGSDYQACLDDYSRVAGPTPLVPRWILGNWWSHYWEYHQAELLNLMHEFKKHEIPLSVCIIDMDWHITKTGNACSGWTGYTWNRELFPDPPGFLKALHELGLRASLNLHPAEGVHPHEEMYPEMAQAMGIDPDSKAPVKFDLENPDFVNPYFRILHHPKEAEGIDFWWMDWQQGNPSSLPGLNLLWWINHLHYHDLGRDERKRPFVFSRWGGLGNHRYPIGFSGDSVISWQSLAFQPYMTATAANVGFGWWSHDIGGHMAGIEEDELYARWVQFGAFSPILRLHCTKNPYHDRRPWGHSRDVFYVTQQAMQLRHALIPYLYCMSWRNYKENKSLVRPMYHEYPGVEEAYACPNQYWFGSELIAAPFISPADPDTRLSRQVVWLPEGDWFGFFDGRYYQGGGWQVIYGSLEEIPVFARVGGIVPMGAMKGWGGIENPEKLKINFFPGADGHFDLYEDDGESQLYRRGKYVITPVTQKWQGDEQVITIGPASGELTCAPAQRTCTLIFHAIREPTRITAEVNGRAALFSQSYSRENHRLEISDIDLLPDDQLIVRLETDQPSLMVRSDHKKQTLSRMIKAFRLGSEAKRHLSLRLDKILADPEELAAFQVTLTASQRRAFLEVICEAGMEEIASTGEQMIILWNNRELPWVTFLASQELVPGTRPTQVFALEAGVAPRFRVQRFDAPRNFPSVWQLDYGRMLRITLPEFCDDFYPRPRKGMV